MALRCPAFVASLLLAAALAAPAARAAGAAPDSSAPPPAPLVLPDDALCAPLVIDQDYGFGATVVLRRIPNARDAAELAFVPGLRHVLIALGEWPSSYEQLQPLQNATLPEGADYVVVLQGWPPSHGAIDAWNYLHAPMRVILIVPGPPSDRSMILDLNRMRPLERVIAQMNQPARSGFERLQRPLSFRVVRR